MIDYHNFSNATNSFEEEIDTSIDEMIYEDEIVEYGEDTMTTGVVDRDKIYLRMEPAQGNNPISVLSRGEELLIDFTKSTDEWYSVCTAAGLEGYVMKKLLKVE